MSEEMRPVGDVLTMRHLAALARALPAFRTEAARLRDWGISLARILCEGGRLLVAGNGGSAAEAQHLAAELVGKMTADRRPLSAIALTAETAGLTAIGNDFGFDEVFARQVRAHGRPGDVLITMSTSGRSANLLAADRAAHEVGMRRWAMTGPTPNPLADASEDALAVPSADQQTVQELHLVSVHLLCAHIDEALPGWARVAGARPPGGPDEDRAAAPVGLNGRPHPPRPGRRHLHLEGSHP
jgi:D-sedoheptulose 7-phosphate isomerase